METVSIRVEGMTCESCEQRLATALGRVEGVSRVSADHETGNVRVLFDAERVAEPQLSEQIVACGYELLASDKS
jgi:copper chaperone CopZ